MSRYRLIVLTALLVSFILRINRLDYPISGTFAWGDGTRDFLVASHIIKFGELPAIGPHHSLADHGSKIKNSPLYFYTLALPLLIYNHPLTLGLINIFGQMMGLVLIFLTTKGAFSSTSAAMTIILLSVNPHMISQSDYIWQPHLMLPIALLSLYLLVKAGFKKSYQLLFFSLMTACLAFAIHNSAFPWLAFFLVVSFLICKKRGQYVKWFGLILSVLLILLILYSPVMLSSDNIRNLPTQSLNGYLGNLNNNLEAIAKVFYINKLLILLILLTALLYNRYNRRNPVMVLTIVLFLLPLLSASFFNKIRVHYLILSTYVFVILVATSLDYLKPKAFKLLFLFLTVWIFSGNWQFIKDIKNPFENLKLIDEITTKVAVSLDQIKQEENYTKYDFFQVKSYAVDEDTFDYPVLDTLFLVPLEMRLKVKLAMVSSDSPFNHEQVNKKDYLLLFCLNPKQYHSSDCTEPFLKKENYYIVKPLYTREGISLYLAKQKINY